MECGGQREGLWRVPCPLLDTPLVFEATWRDEATACAIWSCERLADHVCALSIAEAGRALLNASAERMLDTCHRIRALPPSIESLEQELREFVTRLDELASSLGSVDIIVQADRGRRLAGVELLESQRDYADGIRYLAGQFRLYSRDPLRELGREQIQRAGTACTLGDSAVAVSALSRLRALVAEADGARFQRARRDAVVTKIDALLTAWSQQRASMQIDASARGEWAGLELGGTAQVTPAMGVGQARQSIETKWGVTATADIVVGELEVDVVSRSAVHGDVSGKDEDLSAASLEAEATFAWERCDVMVGFATERVTRPGRFDPEIPPGDLVDVMNGALGIRAAVVSRLSDSAARQRLLVLLDKALLAARELRAEDVVKTLRLFCDQAWKEVFSGTVAESLAQDLVSDAEGLLPRRQEDAWGVPITLSSSVGDWGVSIDIAVDGRSAPADRSWDRVECSASMDAERGIEEGTVSVEASARSVEYKDDAVKSYSARDLSLGLAGPRDAAVRAEAIVESGATVYALDPKKDVCDARSEIEIQLRQDPWELALSVSGTDSRHPRDPSRDTCTAVCRAMLGVATARATLETAWESSRKLSGAEWTGRDEFGVALRVEGTSAELALDLAWTRVMPSGEDVSPAWQSALEVSFRLEFPRLDADVGAFLARAMACSISRIFSSSGVANRALVSSAGVRPSRWPSCSALTTLCPRWQLLANANTMSVSAARPRIRATHGSSSPAL